MKISAEWHQNQSL